jgi:hypothetical protein
MAQGRTWVFTINNYTEEDLIWVKGLEVLKITASSEIGESGTPHIQGAVTFKRQYTLGQLKKLHGTAHWEKAKATQDFNYCKKVDGVVIRDESNAKPGKRTDIEIIREDLEAGADIKQIMKKARTLGGVQFAEKWFNVMGDPLPKGTKILVHWYYGNTGTGKTRKVLEECDPYVPLNFKWWQGYEGQDSILLDDLRPNWCKPEELLRLLDPYRYHYQVEVKGGSRHLVATKIYITTPWHPEDFWKDFKEDPRQLLRRLESLVHFREDGPWVKPR